jgi:uncharacterized protein YukE
MSGTQTELERIGAAAHSCMMFNSEQEHRLQTLRGVVERLQENWKSEKSVAVFQVKWHQLSTAANDMRTAMEHMIQNLNQHRVIIDEAAAQAARTIDMSDSTPYATEAQVPTYAINQTRGF